MQDSDRNCGDGTAYVCHRGHPSPAAAANYVFVHYWMYETASYAPYGTLPGGNSFVHEADWEMLQICVRLKDTADAGNKSKWLAPHAATAAQHFYGQTLAWRQNVNGPAIVDQQYVTNTDNGNRVIVYIAENTHATYFRDGQVDADIIGQKCGTQSQYNSPVSGAYDDCVAPHTEPDCGLFPLNEKDGRGIYDWDGRWGEQSLNLLIPLLGGPMRRYVYDNTGANLVIDANSVTFHNQCRKLIGGVQDPQTQL